MLELLDRKIRQMHEALGDIQSSDLSTVSILRGTATDEYYLRVVVDKDITDAGLANATQLLVQNIACLKDHLKVWCRLNNKPFKGEDLINSDRCVALIHDLWNMDKHAELNQPPRSGHRSQINDLRKALRFSASEGSAHISINLSTGTHEFITEGDGSVGIDIVGDVVDENGKKLGDFADICKNAVTAWENVLRDAGAIR